MKRTISALIIVGLAFGLTATPTFAKNDGKFNLGLREKLNFNKNKDNNDAWSEHKENKHENKDREDKQGPKLGNIMVIDRGETSATIIWFTAEPGDSKVWVSRDRSVNTEGTATNSAGELSYFHSLTLSSLAPGTTYYYVVASTDGDGNMKKSGVKSFNTTETTVRPDTNDPRINSLKINAITQTSASLRLASNEEVTARVWVSTASPVVQNQSKLFTAAEFKEGQSVAATGLSANTLYYAQVEITDRAGNTTMSDVQSFRTLAVDTTAPTIFGPMIINIGSDSARILWLTNEKSDSRVWVSQNATVATNVSATKIHDEDVYMHSVLISDLDAGAAYNIVVGSTDLSGNVRFSSQSSFTTEVQ